MGDPTNPDDLTVLFGSEERTVLSNSEEATVLSAWSDSGAPTGDGPRLEHGQSFGPYTIGRILGRGGMGEVYEADHVETGRRVALKILRGQIQRAEDRARFLSEGQLAASISHPHTVYVFGSEEINGMPVISMQLLTGGTLKDRIVERGPMSPADAVAAILDVIAGLDAAESAGILHRDIKPSNCFIDADGRVKVGDFGLSISTGARAVAESRSGFQGTPQYAPPEQLRGDELDVGADIYAVGATLFFLLTGRAPFDTRDFRELIEQVKTTPPPLAHTVKPGIPPALSGVIAKCLAKERSDRPASYADLARMLRPFSASALPARRGPRFLAGAIDSLILAAPIAMLNAGSVRIASEHFSADVNLDPRAFALNVLYFAVCEGWWQTTIGKRLCSLRVVSTDGSLTWSRAAARALLFHISSVPLVLLGFIFGRARLIEYLTAHQSLAMLSAFVPIVITVLLFVTMTRKNGLAAVHDVLTGTRVVQRLSRDLRRSTRADAAVSTASVATGGRRRYGSFDVTGELGVIPDGRVFEGVDAVLKRRVWIVERAAGAPEVPRARRDADRVGRLHWLAGQRTEQDYWDAFEAPLGVPVDPTPGASAWRDVQGWLNDLSAELASAERDGTMPALSLDRVWIRNDGRAVLLDFPAPGTPAAPEAPAASDRTSPSLAFLSSVARLSLGNTTSSPMPVSAVAMLDRWSKKRGVSVADAVAELAVLSLSVERVSRGRRLIPVAMAALPVVLMLGASVFAIRTVGKVLEHNTFQMLSLVTERDKEINAASRRAIDTYLAGTYHDELTDEDAWALILNSNQARSKDDVPRLRQIARDAAALRPTPAETAAAADHIRETLDSVETKYQKQVTNRGFQGAETILIALLLIGCGMSCFCGLASVLIRPSGFVLATLGLAVLNRRGREISRIGAVARLLIAWSPMLLFSIVLAVPRTRALMLATHTTLVVAGLATAAMAAGTIWTILRPTRGPHDILARTTIGVR